MEYTAILVKAASLILSLSILVLLHEAGHFIPARLFKTKVEKFYLFFDPWFSLFKFKRGETEYGIGWIPLGGYVKIAGMIDESMDKEQMKQPAQPWEFRSKPAWQRLIIMIGGVTVNALLAWFIYSMILFTWGQEILPLENAKYGLAAEPLMQKFGFKDGDKVVSIDTVKPYEMKDITEEILLNERRNITVNRNGKDTTITLPKDFDQIVLKEDQRSLFQVRVPFAIDSVVQDSAAPAFKTNLKKDDQIIGLNGTATPFFHEYKRLIEKYAGKEVDLTVLRKNDTLHIKCAVTKDATIGVIARGEDGFFTLDKREFGFFESIPAGLDLAVDRLVGYVKQFKLLFTKEGIQKVGGPGQMGSLFPETFSDPNYWLKFWNITALLSVILAFMNLLPIPALDGGHVMFLLYEIIFRRKPGEKFMEYAQMVGMILLLSLMAYAIFNDFMKFVF